MTTVAVVASALAVASPSSAQAQAPSSATKLYLVQTAGSPVATYAGGDHGFAATRPAAGTKVDANTSAAKAYRGHLRTVHDDTLRRANIAASRKTSDYAVTFNGFAARLTDSEATRLAHTAGVTQVWKNQIITTDTISTPTFLGLAGDQGVWKKEFGDPTRAGRGIIIGSIDTGLWPENASFAPLSSPSDTAVIAHKFHGICDAGSPGTATPAPAFSCNNKVIGGRFYNTTGLAQPTEFLSPRDLDGHGSHTAGTAAGDYNVPAVINGLTLGDASGMAPAAHIAVYKALWHNLASGNASGGTVDLVAAIDDAVADGVDVINYSISGSTQLIVDPVEIAFFNAAAAGVFIAASAGNDGPGASTVAHNSPWLTTVAASTHDRSTVKSVALGNGASYQGVGVGPGVGPAPIIDSVNAGLAGAPANAVALCFSDADGNPTNGVVPVLDPAKVAGKIVLCKRGTNIRVDKSLAVLNAGGVGMVLYNPTPQSLNADFHSVPSIHVDEVSGAAIKTYADTDASPTATISDVLPGTVEAPAMASFSSRGPANAGHGDLLKPDITAPGVDIIAPVSSPNGSTNTFGDLSGTSMSSPHIAGIAALILSRHPSWSPMWVKSALMTTASVVDNEGNPIRKDSGGAADPLAYGSGHVTPKDAFSPGLVYDSTPADWIAYGCSIGQFQLITDPSFCAGYPTIDPSDLNYPSIAVGDLAGSQTVTRKVTNVSYTVGVYVAKVSAPVGFEVKVSPQVLVVLPHHTKTFKVTITRTTAAVNQYAFGSLTWAGLVHSVRSPIVVEPLALAAPTEVTFSGTSGSADISMKAGYTGSLNTTVDGLVPASIASQTLDPAGPHFNSNAPTPSIATQRVDVTIPAGTTLARFATFASDYAANTDVDIFVYSVTGSTLHLVGQSTGGTADEAVNLTNPAAGTYAFFANLFASPAGPVAVSADSWVLTGSAAGNFTATTASLSVTTGATVNNGLSWTGLTAGQRYVGSATYSDGSATVGRTIVNVNS